jgi:methylated-DNA-[protein]-cysteine S-methyltransferase
VIEIHGVILVLRWRAVQRFSDIVIRQIGVFIESEKRQMIAIPWAICVASNVGEVAVPIQTFSLELLNTPTGPMLIVMDDEQLLRAVDWEDHEQRMQRLLRSHYGASTLRPRATTRPSAARRSLQAYFDGDLAAIASLPTATNGTEFQRTVWNGLRRIPVGHTVSYGALAAQIGRPTAVRAVGLANGANPIAIVVPCHRVIGANASLTGYGGGLDRKRWLLAHEQAA